MALQPSEQVELNFVSDGVASSFAVDLTQPPVRLRFTGKLPSGVRTPTISNAQSVADPTVTATLVGSTVTFTFSAPPPMLDVNNVAVQYTLGCQLVY